MPGTLTSGLVLKESTSHNQSTFTVYSPPIPAICVSVSHIPRNYSLLIVLTLRSRLVPATSEIRTPTAPKLALTAVENPIKSDTATIVTLEIDDSSGSTLSSTSTTTHGDSAHNSAEQPTQAGSKSRMWHVVRTVAEDVTCAYLRYHAHVCSIGGRTGFGLLLPFIFVAVRRLICVLRTSRA